jgi:hypothetical protein
MEQPHTPKVCDICGAEEPLPWFELPMNEEIRAYARSYIGHPKKFYPSLTAALDAWGITIEPEE